MFLTPSFWRWSLLGCVAQVATFGGLSATSAEEPETDSPSAVAAPYVDPSDSEQLAAATFAEAAAAPSSNPATPPVIAAPKKAPPVFPGPKILPPTGPYKPLYFDNDFSYKKDPNHEHVFGEELKNIKFGFNECDEECFTFSTGGELRHRYMHEDNRLRPVVPGGPREGENHLIRWRHYADLKYSDWLRGYVEGIHADNLGNDLPDQAIDVNRWDLLNAFVDVAFLEDDFGTHNVRYGRQELLFGRQRLVSPLDWANTRRNFEGVRYWHKGDSHKFDVFAVNPVNSATGFRTVAKQDNAFDQPNSGVWLSGAHLSYTGIQNTVIEPYWFWVDTQTDVAARPDGSRHTLGGRIAHLIPTTDGCGQEVGVWDLDGEGGWQFGEDNNQRVRAGFLSGVVGHTWKQVTWTPRLSGLFYYGSGDRSPTDNKNGTFQTPFPLGHAYWAISDNLTGQNLYDYSVQLDVKPTKQTAIVSAWHYLDLATSGDKLYNVAGAPVGTPGNGTEVGTGWDIYGFYAVNANFDVQMGYSKFFYGEFIDRTSKRGDAEQFYIQTSFRY